MSVCSLSLSEQVLSNDIRRQSVLVLQNISIIRPLVEVFLKVLDE
jgi:hypothetical protein